MWLLVEVENLAHQYFNTLQVGGPKLLTKEQMEDVRYAMMGGYAKTSELQ
jgi:hypothetical protein